MNIDPIYKIEWLKFSRDKRSDEDLEGSNEVVFIDLDRIIAVNGIWKNGIWWDACGFEIKLQLSASVITISTGINPNAAARFTNPHEVEIQRVWEDLLFAWTQRKMQMQK